MDVMQAIHDRRSIRSFRPVRVDREVIDTLIEAASWAPSSFNSQPWYFHVATGETRRKVGETMALTTVHLREYVDSLPADQIELAERFYAELGNAPVVIALSLPKVSDELDRINEYLAAGAAVENLMLAATELGLGACNITASFWVRDQLADDFHVSEDRVIVSTMLVGYPAEHPAPPEHRRDVATILE